MTGVGTARAGLLEPVRRRVDGMLERELDRGLRGVPGPVAGAVRYAALGPGKRIRPLLLLGAREAAGGELEEAAVRLSCSVELVHAYSLVHDDLPCMDDDVLRRGRPAHHVRFSPSASVIAGAVLMPLAVECVDEGARELGLSEGESGALAGMLLRAAGGSGMVGGQLLDLEAEGTRPDPSTVEAIYRGKTAALIAAATTMGARSASANPETGERLVRFGWRLGVAFQIVDDLLDVRGSERELGKESGRDRVLGKATYPSVSGEEAAEERSRELAASAMDQLEPLGDGARLLRALAEYVIRRRS